MASGMEFRELRFRDWGSSLSRVGFSDMGLGFRVTEYRVLGRRMDHLVDIQVSVLSPKPYLEAWGGSGQFALSFVWCL